MTYIQHNLINSNSNEVPKTMFIPCERVHNFQTIGSVDKLAECLFFKKDSTQFDQDVEVVIWHEEFCRIHLLDLLLWGYPLEVEKSKEESY